MEQRQSLSEGKLRKGIGMTSEEINEAVARKLGWKEDHGIWEYPGKSFRPTPRLYSTSIEAAWEIVDKFEDCQLQKRLDGSWNCLLRNNESGISIERAGTAPLAICLAFLKLDHEIS